MVETTIKSYLEGIDHVFPSKLKKIRLRQLIYFGILIIDFFGIIVSFTLAALWRFGGIPSNFHVQVTFLLAGLHLVIGIRNLNPDVLTDRWGGAREAVSAFFVALAGSLVVAYLLQADIAYSRLWGGMGTVLSIVILVFGRSLVARLCSRVFDGAAISRLVITDDFELILPPKVSRFDATNLGRNANLSDPLVLDRISKFVCAHDEVIVACGRLNRGVWSNILRGFNVPSHMLVPELANYGALGVDRFAGYPMILISTGYLKWRDRILKRAFDLTLSLAAIILLTPIFLVVSLAIWLESSRPILFVQNRVGRGNRLFKIYKFRTMRIETTDFHGKQSAHKGDPRVTRLGSVLRASSCDELPQLFNILRGEMSFVGPRPHAIGSLAGNKLFWEIDERYNYRHVCKPGLTGLAQIRGFRGATQNPQDLVDRLQADLEYAINWSLWRDIKIIISTVKVIVHPNAY